MVSACLTNDINNKIGLKLAHLLGRDGDKEGGVEEFDAVDDTFC